MFFVSHYLSLCVNGTLDALHISCLDGCRIFLVTYLDNTLPVKHIIIDLIWLVLEYVPLVALGRQDSKQHLTQLTNPDTIFAY